ncbi:MAG: restriction endonuclease subunit S [Pirellulaceae bacterium]|nr:restriction endonuclease subunit S [Pirellulaceae bacterium]
MKKSRSPKKLSASAPLCATKHEDSKPALVPKLRFPEFRNAEEWERNEVGDVFQVTRGNVLSMTLVQDVKTEANPYPVYSSQTKNNGLSGYYSDFLFDNAITWTTDGANAGDVNFRPGKFYCTNVCGVLLNSTGFANACIAALINAVAKKYVSYVGNPKLMNGVMSKIPIPFPSLAEQQKIASCLSSVDELMAAQARKVDALKTHKKGLMQQLFPREGETQPRLRFPEFKGEWNDATLGDLCFNVSSGKDARDSDGAFDLYGSTGVIGKTAKASYDTPHILVARVGANAGYLTKASGQFGVTDNTLVIKLKPAARIDYIFHYLGNININKLIFGSGQPLITGSILKAQRVLVPSDAEQSKISNCLSSIDDLIKAESDKLEALNAHKKGLMQQLFPSAEEGEG